MCLKGLQTGVCCSVRSSAKSSHVCCDKRSPRWDVQGTCQMLSSMGVEWLGEALVPLAHGRVQ